MEALTPAQQALLSRPAVPSLRLDDAPAAIYLASLAPSGRVVQHRALNVIASFFGDYDAMSMPWHRLRYQHAVAIRTALVERYAPATVNRMLAAFCRVVVECRRLGLIDAETERQVTDIKSVKDERLPAGRAIEYDELAALVAVCDADGSPAGARDAALLLVAANGGMRRAELVALTVADYDPPQSTLTVRAGKGRKDRVVSIGPTAAEALDSWLAVRGPHAGPLFSSTRQARRTREVLTPQAILVILRKRAKQAGVAQLSPHDLRRTMVTWMLDADVDVGVVSRQAGHANTKTTLRYDRRGQVAQRTGASKVVLPRARRRS